MSGTTLKVVAVVSVLLAVVLAVIGFQISRNYAEQAQQAQQQVRQQQVQQTLAVVALKPLPAYEPIARDAVALVPVAIAPPGLYGSIDDVIGKVPLVDIDAGAPVTQRYFKEGNLLARIIPPGHQAVSIEVNDVVAVGGFVRPGDIVDVLVYLRGTGGSGGSGEAQSRVLLEAVRVLAYQERIIDRPEGIKEDDKQRAASRVRTAVIAVPEKDTTKLMLGSSLGELRLALHSQNPDLAAAPADAQRSGPLDKAISIAELARIKPPPSASAPRPRIEILRGNTREVVTTQ